MPLAISTTPTANAPPPPVDAAYVAGAGVAVAQIADVGATRGRSPAGSQVRRWQAAQQVTALGANAAPDSHSIARPPSPRDARVGYMVR